MSDLRQQDEELERLLRKAEPDPDVRWSGNKRIEPAKHPALRPERNEVDLDARLRQAIEGDT